MSASSWASGGLNTGGRTRIILSTTVLHCMVLALALGVFPIGTLQGRTFSLALREAFQVSSDTVSNSGKAVARDYAIVQPRRAEMERQTQAMPVWTIRTKNGDGAFVRAPAMPRRRLEKGEQIESGWTIILRESAWIEFWTPPTSPGQDTTVVVLGHSFEDIDSLRVGTYQRNANSLSMHAGKFTLNGRLRLEVGVYPIDAGSQVTAIATPDTLGLSDYNSRLEHWTTDGGPFVTQAYLNNMALAGVQCVFLNEGGAEMGSEQLMVGGLVRIADSTNLETVDENDETTCGHSPAWFATATSAALAGTFFSSGVSLPALLVGGAALIGISELFLDWIPLPGGGGGNDPQRGTITIPIPGRN